MSQLSLHEIASFLLVVHDSYLKDAVGQDILTALMTLVHDMGLNDYVSILDAEYLRLKVMNLGEIHLGYDLFYDWLRGIGNIVYRGEYDASGRRALHYLLMQYVIPFASKLGTNKAEKSVKLIKLPYFTKAALKVMVDFSELLLLWYLEIQNEQVGLF